jgi:toluene monooxygenase system protein E
MAPINKRPRSRTWSVLGDVRKKPSEYEVVTGKFQYHFRKEPAPFELDPHTPVNTWYLRYREGSAFQAESWEGLRDPRQLNYRRYVKQQHEGETYLENLLDEFERQNHDAQLDPGWVKVLERFYIPSRYPLHIMQMSGLYLGQMAPSAYIGNAAFFQAGDELRAL